MPFGGTTGSEPHEDSHGLAVALAPVLRKISEGRLGPIEWFRSTHQRGGASTGFSTWEMDHGPEPVLVKLPVGPLEHRWTTSLGACEHSHWRHSDSWHTPTPRVLASGNQLGGYDLAWLVTERLAGPALAKDVCEQSLTKILEATADFQAAAIRQAPLTDRPVSPDWDKTMSKAREVARAGGIPEGQRWNDAIHKVQRALPSLQRRWEARPINAWCHGDVHPGNALWRGRDGEEKTCVLIDLALVHPGHWLEDALYLERQFWGCDQVVGQLKPVPMLAKLRRARGLPADDHYGELAMVRRVLMAACAPVLVAREGGTQYLHAALGMIEKYLPQVTR
jgi:hypothetical protein